MKKISNFTCIMIIVASLMSISVEAKKNPNEFKKVSIAIKKTKSIKSVTKYTKPVVDCWYDRCGHILGCCIGGQEHPTTPAPVCREQT
jgi:hypothetical protein